MHGAWSIDEALAEGATRWPGLALEVAPELPSTNGELMQRARAGQALPTVLVAERQTAGRGRLGRQWESAEAGRPADSLTFSIGLPLAPRDWSGLSLAVGVSVAESLSAAYGIDLRIKWPNDLWLADRKLAGILIETAVPQAGSAERYLVIGIGINVGARNGEGLRTPPAWLGQAQPDARAQDVLRVLMAPLLRDVARFETHGFVPFAERYAARDALRGRELVLSDGSTGVGEGVGWGGELLLRTSAGVRLVSSAEVSVRPRDMESLR